MNHPARLSEPAREMLLGMSLFWRVRPALLMRVIVESYLDAAAEDGALQVELVAAARSLRCSGRVPGCWLALEGDDAELFEGDLADEHEGDETETDLRVRGGA